MKVFTGKVIAKKMTKTVSVAVSRFVSHKVYGKRIKRVKHYQVHDEYDTELGKTVKFVASKPYSKSVKWNLLHEAKKENKKVEKVVKTKAKKGETK